MLNYKQLMVLAVLSKMVSTVISANILVFIPFPGKSHHKVFVPIARELAIRGHNVTVFSPYPIDNPPPNYTQLVIPDFTEKLRVEIGIDNESKFMSNNIWNTLRKNNLFVLWEMGHYFMEMVYQEETFQSLIASDSRFDLVIHESAFVQEGFIALQHRFGAISVEACSFSNSHWTYWLFGNPFDPSYIVDVSAPYSDKMTFLQRLHNTVLSLTFRTLWYNMYLPSVQSITDKYFRYTGWEKRPTINQMQQNTSLVLINTHVSLNYPYPMASHFKEIGAINLTPPGSLSKDLKDFLDNATDGVIYFTLGSYIQVSSTLGEELRVEFSKAFEKLKQKILWKWETPFDDKPFNVRTDKWFPQNEILSHKNVKLFITHGGFLSMTEALYNGVPLIGIPILGDQKKNVATFAAHGFGLHLEYTNLTEPAISWAINEILSNPMYKLKAVERSKLILDRPETPLQSAIYWIEYVLKFHGAPHLRPVIHTLPWYQQAMIDVYLVISVIVLVFLCTFMAILKTLLSAMIFMCYKSKRERESTKKAKRS